MLKIFIDRREADHIFLLEGKELKEYHIEESKGLLGNIYRARVEKILRGMDSAFVNIGVGKNAYLSLKNLNSTRNNSKNLEDKFDIPLKEGQEIICQVIKEAFKDKGAKITREISLVGSYMVFTPYRKGIKVSRKIQDRAEIDRLKLIGESLTDKRGIIFRTASAYLEEEAIREEYKELEGLYEKIIGEKNFLPTPKLIYKNKGILHRIIRDRLNEDFTITFNSENLYDEILQIGKMLNKTLKDSLFLEKDFKYEYNEDIQKGIKKALSHKVRLASGGYIVIDELEALTAIDINTGKYIGESSYEETVEKINFEACQVIADQIRIRNLSGIIIIDFIDMKEKESYDKLLRNLETLFEKDRNKANIIGITKLGLVEITRKRLSPSLQQIRKRDLLF